LDKLEGLFVSRIELTNFRNSIVYNDFQKRWNGSIYFGLRFQSIARTLEKALNEKLEMKSSSGTPKFSFYQTIILWNQLEKCWSPKIFINSLTDSFFRLSLQLVSRYATYITKGIEEFKKSNVSILL